MPVPSPRTPILPARGNKSDLLSNIGSLKEGEICYALDEDALYVKEAGALVKASNLAVKPDLRFKGYVQSGTTAPASAEVGDFYYVAQALTIDSSWGIQYPAPTSRSVRSNARAYAGDIFIYQQPPGYPGAWHHISGSDDSALQFFRDAGKAGEVTLRWDVAADGLPYAYMPMGDWSQKGPVELATNAEVRAGADYVVPDAKALKTELDRRLPAGNQLLDLLQWNGTDWVADRRLDGGNF